LSSPRRLIADALALSTAVLRVKDLPRRPGAVAIWICAGAALLFALVAALAPEIEYDAAWYHLWLPLQWLEAGRLRDIVSEYVSLYPGGWELLNGAALALGGPTAAKLLHFACLPLLGAAACLLASATRVPLPASLVFALVVTAPTMMWEGSTAYVDLALAWLVTLGCVALFRYHDSNNRRWLVAAAVTLGGAVAVKHLALIALAVCGITLFVRELRVRTLQDAVVSCAVVGGVALLFGVPWYLRAYAASGNPVFPELYKVFGASPSTRWSMDSEYFLDLFKAHFGMGRSVGSLVLLPWNMTTHAAYFGGTFGPLFLILVPFAWTGREPRRLTVVGLGALAYGAVWASPLGSFQLRFLTPVVPPLAVLGAAGAAALASESARVSRVATRVVTCTIVALLAVNLPPFVEWHETDRRGWDGWLTHVLRGAPASVVFGAEPESSYLARSVPAYRAWAAIDKIAPADARVLTFIGGDYLYSHRSRLWSDATAAWPITWSATSGDVREVLDAAMRAGISYVLFDKRQWGDDKFSTLTIASPAMRSCCLRPVYEDGRVEVDALRFPDRNDASTLADR
jgi:hypothetical protein